MATTDELIEEQHHTDFLDRIKRHTGLSLRTEDLSRKRIMALNENNFECTYVGRYGVTYEKKIKKRKR